MKITIEFCIFELICNPSHNILELYSIGTVQVRFTTSQIKLERKYQKNLKLGWTQPSAQSPFKKLDFANSS